MFSGMRAVLGGVAAGAMLLSSAATTSLLRKDLSKAVVLNTTTGEETLAHLVGGKPRALLLMPQAFPAKLCKAISIEVQRVRDFGLEVTLMGSNSTQNPCEGVPTYSLGKALLELMANDAMPESGVRAVVLDGDGVVRLDEMLDMSATQSKPTGDRLIAWNQGRESFAVHCGHCHDDDGANTSYVGIKTLAGISTRMSDTKIAEGGEMFGAVALSTWKKSEVDSLLLFIRGL